eukprot:410967_1
MFLSLFLLFVLLINIWSCFADDIICPSYPPPTYLDPSVFSNILNEIDQYIEETIMKENNITGFITTIVYDQQLLFSKGYGFRNYMNTSSPPPTGDDLVMIASNTKLFTSLLTYYLRDHNEYNLSLNDPITKYLPTFSTKSIYSSDSEQPMTLNELLSHTSGLQDTTPFPYEKDENAILKTLSNRYLLFEKYKKFHYSNLGFALLGRSIEKVFCDGCYEQYTKKYILNGLNFSKYSGFNFSDYIKDNYVAYGWYIGVNGERKQAPLNGFGWANPNGGMLASANDMAKFMMFMFRDNETTSDNIYQILNGNTINEMLKPKIFLNDGKEAIGTPFEMHYHEFETLHNYDTYLSGVWYKGKQGEVLGYRSSTMMITDYKLGVFTVALEDPDYISEGSVWSNNMLDMMLPVLDNLLYDNYMDNIAYFVPENWKLLVGTYLCGVDFAFIILETNQRGQQYLLFVNGMSKYNIQLFYDGIMDVFRLGNDVENTEGTCFWEDQVNELLYFDFSNGNDTHCVAFRFDENPCVYTPTN